MLRYLILSSALALASSEAMAFKLNPCLRVLVYSQGALSAAGIRNRNRCAVAPEKLRQAVHEHMTNFAVNKYRGKVGVDPAINIGPQRPAVQRLNYMTSPPWTVAPNSPEHRTHALIYGTWWNDDPLMYLWGEGGDLINGLLAFRQVLARDGAEAYAGGVANCRVTAAQHLTRASHFGSLQYLHFMTNLKEDAGSAARVRDTLDRSLVWIKFAYEVATEAIKPTDSLGSREEELPGLPSIAQNLCLANPSNLKVRSLFSRQGLPMAYRNDLVRDVALGSIFHILQDSFSPAHTCRVLRRSEGKLSAVLFDVYNYNEQRDSEHSELDGYPEWLAQYARSGVHAYMNDPIAVGAWLISAVDAKLPWANVELHLRATIFDEASGEERASGRSNCIRLKLT